MRQEPAAITAISIPVNAYSGLTMALAAEHEKSTTELDAVSGQHRPYRRCFLIGVPLSRFKGRQGGSSFA
jgi:hypothetical protein